MSRTLTAALALLLAGPMLLPAQESTPSQSGSSPTKKATKSTWGEEDFLKLIRADSFTVIIPNVQRFIDRGEPIAEEIKLYPIARPRSLVALLTSSLGLPEGYDITGPWALVMPDGDVLADRWSMMMAVSDLDKMLARTDLRPADLAGEKIVAGSFASWPRDGFFMLRDRCLWFSREEAVLTKLAGKKTLHQTLSPSQRKELADKDLIVHISANVADADRNRDTWFEDIFGEKANAKTKAIAEVLVQNVNAFRFTLKFDKGIHTQAKLNFADRPQLRDALTQLVGEGESELVGIPTENLIAASSVQGMSESSPELIRELLRASFLFWFSNGLSEFQMSAIGELFRDAAAQIDHSNIAAYTTSDMRAHGAMGLVAVITPNGTPEQFVTELRSLSSFVSARLARDLRVSNVPVDYAEIDRLVASLGSEVEQERRAASTKLRIVGQPALESLDKADKLGAIDLAPRAAELARRIRSDIRRESMKNRRNGLFEAMKPQFLFRRNAKKPKRPVVEILLEPGAATDRLNKQLTPMFGSEWKRMRFAVLEKHVVVMFGSDQTLLDRVIASVEAGDKTLSRNEYVGQFRERAGSQRLAEWHFEAAKVISIVNAMTGKPAVEEKGGLSSLSISKRPTELRADFFSPISELKIWYKRFGM
ncbi:MAG: hypothetical protein AB8G99_21715 [Planctomycetaceae bacterium]